ncbi:MAG: hypothetical protein A2252_07485 [Elusimicrobia bacterium RIFOXYA2_FULL_39_19]|nr:MAG: hypothetical protein A2252_07485 [Elusimicrobia bacterium RIFOXYA2_FULL_39_19]
MKVALVYPPLINRTDSYDFYKTPLLSMGYLSGFLKSKGIEVTVFDYRSDNLDISGTVSKIKEFNPDLIGLTAKTNEITDASGFADMLKKELPSVPIVVGGPHTTAMTKETMESFQSFDFSVFGEGEITLYELCEKIQNDEHNYENIQGLAFRKNGSIIINQPRPFNEAIDLLPFPEWGLWQKKHDNYCVMGSRGCPFQCIFCMRVLGKKVRFRSPENIVGEIEYLINKFDVKSIDFEDETLNIRKDFVNKFCQLIIDKQIEKKIYWTSNLRADLTDIETLKIMKRAGCSKVAIGIESGNAEMLKTIGKGIKKEQIENVVKMAKKVGLKTTGLFILGHPNETIKTIKDTINYAAKLNTSQVAFGIMVPYPGTKIYEMAKKNEGGYRLISNDWKNYDKYMGNSVEFVNISRKKIEYYQFYAYLKFYVWNFKIIEMIKFVLLHRKSAVELIKRITNVFVRNN